MSNTFDRVIIGDLVCIDPVLRDGIIAAIGQGAPATNMLDHRGRLILAGLGDRHVHDASTIGWPGVGGAPRSAAAGGVTTPVDTPYDLLHPGTTACKLADKIGWVERTAHVDMALYGTILRTGGVDASPELVADGISAFKLSTYEYDAVRFPRPDHPTIVEAPAAITRTDLPVVVHVEDQEQVERLTAAAHGPVDRGDNASPHPRAAAETMANLEIFEIALQTGTHLHIATHHWRVASRWRRCFAAWTCRSAARSASSSCA